MFHPQREIGLVNKALRFISCWTTLSVNTNIFVIFLTLLAAYNKGKVALAIARCEWTVTRSYSLSFSVNGPLHCTYSLTVCVTVESADLLNELGHTCKNKTVLNNYVLYIVVTLCIKVSLHLWFSELSWRRFHAFAIAIVQQISVVNRPLEANGRFANCVGIKSSWRRYKVVSKFCRLLHIKSYSHL